MSNSNASVVNSESSKSNVTIGMSILKTLLTFPGKVVPNNGKCMIICKFLMTPKILDKRPYNQID